MNRELSCEQVKTAMFDLVLEEISPAERGELELHLQGCRSCSREMAEFQRTKALLVRGAVSEEIPRRIRMVAEPTGRWMDFWRNPARLAFAGAGLLCISIALLALFRTNISYQSGNFQIAFGVRTPAEALVSGAAPSAAMPVAASASRSLDQAQVSAMISQAIAAAETEQQKQSGLAAQTVALQMEQRWQHDLHDMSESLHYFQAAQTMLWKGQVQNQQLVSTLMHQSGLATPEQQ